MKFTQTGLPRKFVRSMVPPPTWGTMSSGAVSPTWNRPAVAEPSGRGRLADGEAAAPDGDGDATTTEGEGDGDGDAPEGCSSAAHESGAPTGVAALFALVALSFGRTRRARSARA